jgi:hypothetical protein
VTREEPTSEIRIKCIHILTPLLKRPVTRGLLRFDDLEDADDGGAVVGRTGVVTFGDRGTLSALLLPLLAEVRTLLEAVLGLEPTMHSGLLSLIGVSVLVLGLDAADPNLADADLGRELELLPTRRDVCAHCSGPSAG